MKYEHELGQDPDGSEVEAIRQAVEQFADVAEMEVRVEFRLENVNMTEAFESAVQTELARTIIENYRDDEDDDDEERKPCGEYHPLPCGVDEECGQTEQESDEATESENEGQAPTRDEEIDESDSEPAQSEDAGRVLEGNSLNMSIQPGSTKRDWEGVAPGTRKRQVLDFFEEHRGEWVDLGDFVEYAPDLDTESQQDRNIAGRALLNAIQYEWLDVEKRQVSAAEGGRQNEFQFDPQLVDEDDFASGSAPEPVEEEDDQDEGDEEEIDESGSEPSHEHPDDAAGEITHDNIPGTVSKGTHEYQTLALLTHLCERHGAQSIDDLADVGRLTRKQFSATMSGLKQKTLVEQVDEPVRAGADSKPGTWQPTQAGRAELERLGGFQLNDEDE